MVLLLLFFMIFLVILVIVLLYFFFIPFFYGVPFEPSRGKALKDIITFTKPNKKDFIVELGSGDGRICIELGKKGAKVYGFEINPFLVLISRRKIKKLGLNNVKIYWKDFWRVNLSKYNKVVMFQFKTITQKLSKKFKKELKPGSLIISHWWRLPKWQVQNKVGRVYLYKKPL